MTTLPADELVERHISYLEGMLENGCLFSGEEAAIKAAVGALAELSSLRAKLAEAMEVVRALVNAPVWLDADTPDGPEWAAVTPAELIAPLRAARRLIEGNGNG